ncbi:hypothetical protein ACHWQZ_G004319 [Mnemiopsis leidyi]
MESLKDLQNPSPEYSSSSTLLSFLDKDVTRLIPRPLPGTKQIPVSYNGAQPNTKSLINRLKVNKGGKMVEHLTIYTQNIWFSPSDQEERFGEIVKFIEEFLPDFVCLQECIAQFTALLLKSEKIVRTYHISQNSGNWYTVQILSKWPCHITKLSFSPHTMMARSLLLASTVINRTPVTVSTTHFESSDGKEGYTARCKQMEIAFSALKEHENVLIMGDFNFDAVRGKEEEARDKSFVDLFDCKSGTTLDFTYIPRRDRLDRMLLRGRDWEATGHYFLVGTEPIPKYSGMSIYEGNIVRSLSDHLGIISVIKFKGTI